MLWSARQDCLLRDNIMNSIPKSSLLLRLAADDSNLVPFEAAEAQ
jgi:hypothetical protein